MGITGLIQFIENASNRTNIKDFNGSVFCVDAYCWLHRGIYACSEILAMGGSTDIHIKYCLKYVRMLLHHNIKPILVFDGQHLPAKEETEKKRRESRKQAKARATELLRLGKKSEARKFFNRCVDVTHKMAMELMAECRKLDVDCIVAPYEADAQMAFLNICGIADYVVTEDSDLTLFGCKKILYKLDLMSNCLEVDNSKFHLAMGCSLEKYSFQKFRYMCIISGCDYLDSLPGIGLAKACKFILKTEEEDMNRALDKIPAYLNMRRLEVTAEYKLNFLRANATFMHMFVYDPKTRKMVRLTEPSEHNTDIQLCCNSGSMLDDKTAFQLAIGNLDPFTLQKLNDWSPQSKSKNSIWYNGLDRGSQFGQSTGKNEEKLMKNRVKQKQHIDKVETLPIFNEISLEEKQARDDVLSTYTHTSPPLKKLKSSDDDEVLSSNKFSTRNPFCLTKSDSSDSTNLRPLTKTISPVKKPNPFSKMEKRKLTSNSVVISRFFSKPESKTEQKIDDTSKQKEIKEKFLHVKSLYDSSVSSRLSIYSKLDNAERQLRKNGSDTDSNVECIAITEEIRKESNEIVEMTSDSEEDRTTKTLNTFIHQKSIGTLLDNNVFRIVVGLRLGVDICRPHLCVCGSFVDKKGRHGLKCKNKADRYATHAELNNTIKRALVSAEVPARLEPVGLSRNDGKRVDGITMIPWSRGSTLVWDATCTDTFAPSNLNFSSIRAGRAADNKAQRKKAKYSTLIENGYIFVPFAVETMGPWGTEALSFFNELANKIALKTDEPRSKMFLKQKISMAIQRGNAAAIMGTFRSSENMEEIFYLL